MTLLMRDQENIEKGREEGRQETEERMIIEMLKNHLPLDTIEKITGVPQGRIRKLIGSGFEQDSAVHIGAE